MPNFVYVDKNEYGFVVVQSDGTREGTKVFVCGNDVTRFVRWQVPESFFSEDRPTQPPTQLPGQAIEPGPCRQCNGHGYQAEAAKAGKLVACEGCYGRGKS